MSQASSPATKRAYSAGHFELVIDGHASSAFLRSVDGGYIKGQNLDEAIGSTNARIKHTSAFDIEPIAIDVGLAGAGDILKWIQGSWHQAASRRSGQITHGDFDFRSVYELEYRDALITETTFPTLDGASKEGAYLKVKIQPEFVRLYKGDGHRLNGRVGTKQKSWIPSAFNLYLDGLDELKFTNRIEGFTIKQGIKKLHTGENRFPEIEPTKIEYPNLVGTIALEYADHLFKWSERVLRVGVERSQKTGRLEFLNPQRDKVMFQINLSEVGLHSFNIGQSTANVDQIKRAKFELHVGSMSLGSPWGPFSGKMPGLE